MKKVLLSLFIFTGCIVFNAQNISIDKLLSQKSELVKRYDISFKKPNTLLLKMDFNSPEILNKEDVNFLENVEISKVELYYTAFQISESFSQPKLNRARLENLKAILPSVFDDPDIVWVFKGQNDCKDEEQARTYFHGFVITYVSKSAVPDTKREIADIKKIALSDSLGYDSVYTVYQTKLKRKKYKTGYYLPVIKSKRDKGIVYERRGIAKRKTQYAVRVDTVRYGVERHKFVKDKNAMSFVKRNLSDSTIFAVLRRNANWKDIAFVCDVTGSMSAYTTQLMVWYKLNAIGDKVQSFTFFNDGDNKPEWKKKIGKIGGVYQVEAGNYEAVAMVIEKAMLAGGGGDAPENNCEALIGAIKAHPEAKEYVMIADNFANIKDIELMKQINKPVHIILCGTSEFIVNTDYLDLARATKGSIHSIEQDIENLVNINEGQIVTFDHKKYILKQGKFQQLLEM